MRSTQKGWWTNSLLRRTAVNSISTNVSGSNVSAGGAAKDGAAPPAARSA